MDSEKRKNRPIPKGRARKQDNASREVQPIDRPETEQQTVGLRPDLESLRRETQERERAEAALKRAEREYRHLVESAHDAILIFRPEDEVVLEVNQRACELYGFTRAEFIGMSLEKITHDIPRGKVQIQATLDQGFYHHFESVHYRKDGSEMFVEINGSRVNYQGQWAIQSINRDITERKQAEEKLLSQYSTLQAIIGSADALIFSLDKDYRYTSFNQNHAAMMKALYGVDIEIGMSLLDSMTVEEDRKTAKGNLDRALQGESVVESSYSGEEEFSRRYFEVSHNPIRTPGGEIIGVAVLAKDQTERRRAEEALRESEARYRTFVQHFPGIAYRGKMDFTPLFFHGAVEAITGYPEEQFIAGKMKWDQMIHPDDLPQIQAMEAIRTVSGFSTEREYRIVRKDGQVRWIVEWIQNLSDDSGKPVLVQGTLFDITERKRTEEALCESEEKYRLLVENSQQGILVLQDSKLQFANPRAVQHSGYSLTEMTSRPFLELVHPEDRAMVGDRYTRRLKGEEIPEIYQFRFLDKEGRVQWVEVNSVQITWRGKPAALSFLSDITERKRADEVLAYQASLLANVHDAVIAFNEDLKVTSWNLAAEEMYGWKAEEVIGRTRHEVLHTDYVGIPREEAIRTLKETGQFQGVLIQQHRGGQRIYTETKAVALKDSAGRITGYVSVNRDITERKRVEEVLRQSEARYRLLAENVTDLIWMMDLSMRFTYLSPSVTRLTGFSVEEALSLSLKETLTPSSFQLAMQTFSEEMALESSGRADPARSRILELEQRCKDGSAVAIEVTTTFLRDSQGRPVGVLGVSRDITARKRAEQALRESESRNRAILDALPDLMFIQNADGVYLDYHASDPGLLLLPPERFLGKNMREVLPSELSARFAELFGLLWKTGVTQVLEYPLRLSGENRFFEARIVACGHDRVLSLVRDITAHKQAESALQQREREVTTLLDSLPAYAYFKKAGSVYVAANRKFCEAVGIPQSGIADKSDYDLFPRELAEKYRTDDARMVIAGETLWVGEEEMVDRGRRFVVETRKVPVKDEKGTVVGLIGLGFDITERKALEEQLLQSQKMEAVGRLAGGVAHDFNNILTAIMGYSDVLLSKLPPEDLLRRFPEGILETVDRASNLTNQLLAFSRRQDVQPEVLSLNGVVAEMDRMLRRLIGEDVELISDLEPALGLVKADAVQLEQVLMNLAVNARDAMSQGGRLTIKTSNVELDLDYVRRHVGLEPGPYVLLSVTDTGHGMGPEVQAHLFEPFFTTKDKGKGTGLGLSTVYGIVKQTGGHIQVESTPGEGTTFRIFLPRHTGEEALQSPVPEAEPARTLQGTETILVVEDDEGVRKRACEILQGYGYVIREAGHGEEALAVAKEHPGPIHLLVADVVMPQVSGPELARRLAPSRPEMKVLFISGYTDGELASYGVLREGTSLLRKPFKPEALARRVRALLDAP
jgi:PAS domain S-box-containing protein